MNWIRKRFSAFVKVLYHSVFQKFLYHSVFQKFLYHSVFQKFLYHSVFQKFLYHSVFQKLPSIFFGKTNTKYNLKTTFNMDDFKTIYIHENLQVVAYFLINVRIYLVSLGNPTFSNMLTLVRHVLKTFELWTLCERLRIFSLYISHLFLSSQQASIAIWTILISMSWWWLLKPKR